MRRRGAGIGLTVAAAVSALLAIVLSCGYLGDFGVYIYFNSAVQHEDYQLALVRGCVSFRHSRVSMSSYFKVGLGHGVVWYFHPGLPEPRSCLWEFDAHLQLAGPAGVFDIFAFPIWCVLLPCLIAPLIWLRRLRIKPQGFAVIQPTDT